MIKVADMWVSSDVTTRYNCRQEINRTKFCAYDLCRSYAWMNDLLESPSPSLCHPNPAAVFVPAVNLLIDDSSLIA